MKLKLDLHVHTRASFDSRMSIEKAVSAARKRGLDGIAVCDHNICYNEPTELNGLIIIPGVEYSTEYGHLLGLFLERPAECEIDASGRVVFADAARAIREAGGICILAHPYQKRKIPEGEIGTAIDELRGELDGIEIFNSRAAYRRADANRLAREKAVEFGLRATAGSDAHSAPEVGAAYLEVEAESTGDIKRAILEGRTSVTGEDSSPVRIAKSQLVKCIRKKRYSSLPKTVAFYGACLLWSLKRKVKKYRYHGEKLCL